MSPEAFNWIVPSLPVVSRLTLTAAFTHDVAAVQQRHPPPLPPTPPLAVMLLSSVMFPAPAPAWWMKTSPPPSARGVAPRGVDRAVGRRQRDRPTRLQQLPDHASVVFPVAVIVPLAWHIHRASTVTPAAFPAAPGGPIAWPIVTRCCRPGRTHYLAVPSRPPPSDARDRTQRAPAHRRWVSAPDPIVPIVNRAAC